MGSLLWNLILVSVVIFHHYILFWLFWSFSHTFCPGQLLFFWPQGFLFVGVCPLNVMWTWAAFWPLYTLPVHTLPCPEEISPRPAECWNIDSGNVPSTLSPTLELQITRGPSGIGQLELLWFQPSRETAGSDCWRAVVDPRCCNRGNISSERKLTAQTGRKGPGMPRNARAFQQPGSCIPGSTRRASCWQRQLPGRPLLLQEPVGCEPQLARPPSEVASRRAPPGVPRAAHSPGKSLQATNGGGKGGT